MQTPAQKRLYLALAVALLAPAACLAASGVALAAEPHGAVVTSPHAKEQPAAPTDSRQQDTTAQTTAAAKKSKKKQGQSTEKLTQLKGVVVIGYRQSIDNALAQKRESNAIIEVINAQSISQFPAKDVADALQHLPGVIITRNGGEGKNVSIRGLSPALSLTELNGNFIANAQAEAGGLTRSFNYLLLPAQMIASVDVYKSQEAKLDAGGIGGTVILHTRRPLQMPANTGFVSVKGVSSDTMGKVEPRVSAMYSWHDKSGTFGFLVGAGYQKRDVRDYLADASSWHWWADGTSPQNYAANPPTLVSGKPVSDPQNVAYWGPGGVVDQSGKTYNGYWMPQQFSVDQRTERRRRESSQVTVQFRPSSNFLLTGNYFRFAFNNDNVNNTFEVPEWGLDTSGGNSAAYAVDQGRQLAPNGLTFDPSHTIVTGAKYLQPAAGTGCAALVNPVTGAPVSPSNVCSQQYPWTQGNYDLQSAKSQSVNIKGEWSAGMLDASFNVGRSWSNGGPSVSFHAAVKPRVFKNGQWVNGNELTQWNLAGKPSITVSPDVLKNLLSGVGQFDLGSTGAGTGTTKMAQNYGQLDFTLSPDVDWIDSLQFGVKYTDTHGSQTSIEQRWLCPGTDEQFQQCDPDAGDLLSQFIIPHSLKTNTKAYDTNVFTAINFPVYYAYLNQKYGGLKENDEPQNFGGIREQDESAYFQLNYNYGRLRGNVGIRWMRVLQDTNIGTQVETLNQEYYQTVPGPTGTPLFCPNSGINKVGGPCAPGDFQYKPSSEWDVKSVALAHNYRAYTKALPSVNIVYSLPHNIQLRGAWAEAMAPPGYGDLLQTGSITHVTEAYYHDRSQFGSALPGWYGSGGNPGLKEFTAKQYDLAAAWYPVAGSVISVDYFHKNVQNFVVPVTLANQTINVGGQNITMTTFGTIGNGQSGTSKGFEFSGQYTSPTGFGVLANYTTNQTSSTNVTVDNQVVGTSKLVGSAKYAGNLSLFYQKHKLLVRVSENWTGPVIDGLVTGMTEYQQPYKQIDLNAHYSISKHFQITGSILNLTRQMQRSKIGDDTVLRLSELEYSGRQYYLGLTYNFGAQ
ncbi:MAG TPA: TonB-dependent receptor [Rhodanobacteraceae bacterium]